MSSAAGIAGSEARAAPAPGNGPRLRTGTRTAGSTTMCDRSSAIRRVAGTHMKAVPFKVNIWSVVAPSENTLGDIYGSLDQIKAASPSVVLSVK